MKGGKMPVGGGGPRVAGRALLWLCALAFAAQITMGITGIPQRWVTWFTAGDFPSVMAPRTIVVLGGAGIPSESGLIRTFYAAEAGRRYPDASLICALTEDQDPEHGSVGRMRDELVLRGIARERVRLEYRGRNTHEQARAIGEMLGEAALGDPLLVVTSPSHARRSVLCFRKAGFQSVACMAALDADVEADLGQGRFVRYGFWSALESQVRFGRELVALAYYRLRGWI